MTENIVVMCWHNWAMETEYIGVLSMNLISSQIIFVKYKCENTRNRVTGYRLSYHNCNLKQQLNSKSSKNNIFIFSVSAKMIINKPLYEMFDSWLKSDNKNEWHTLGASVVAYLWLLRPHQCCHPKAKMDKIKNMWKKIRQTVTGVVDAVWTKTT